MGKFRSGVVPYVDLHLFPVSFIIADLLTGSTNRQHATQGLDFRKCIPESARKVADVYFSFLWLLSSIASILTPRLWALRRALAIGTGFIP
jgi:hypothetical protein